MEGLFQDAGGGGAGCLWLVVAFHLLAETECVGGGECHQGVVSAVYEGFVGAVIFAVHHVVVAFPVPASYIPDHSRDAPIGI